jgi:hypothetical protein
MYGTASSPDPHHLSGFLKKTQQQAREAARKYIHVGVNRISYQKNRDCWS